MKRLLVATTLRFPSENVEPENRAMVDALADRGLRPELRPWHSEIDPWLEADLVLVRTTWDYPVHLDEFVAWLDALDAAGVRVINPTPFLRWNLSKTYLIALAAAGVPIVAVTRAAAGSVLKAAPIRRVVKPEVGVGGIGAFVVEAGESPTLEFDAVVNPYMPRVADGELSVFIVDGKVVITFRKRPAGEEFRVHIQYGGSYEVESDPPAPALQAAMRAFEVVNKIGANGELVYLRVDLLEGKDDEWLVLEVEGVEPSLYPSVDMAVTDALAGAISRRLPEA